MVKRYLKTQLTVLLFGGLVGPIFLAVYFALGSMARPYLNWMFWVGLFITSADVLVALALTNYGARTTGIVATTASQRLQQLDMLHATGAITDDEYTAKRRDILDQI